LILSEFILMCILLSSLILVLKCVLCEIEQDFRISFVKFTGDLSFVEYTILVRGNERFTKLGCLLQIKDFIKYQIIERDKWNVCGYFSSAFFLLYILISEFVFAICAIYLSTMDVPVSNMDQREYNEFRYVGISPLATLFKDHI